MIVVTTTSMLQYGLCLLLLFYTNAPIVAPWGATVPENPNLVTTWRTNWENAQGLCACY